MNPRVTQKEHNLIKGSLRRVFSRSDLRRKVISTIIINHTDPSRKRVKTWGLCPICKIPDAISNFVVDHIIPVVGIEETVYDLDANTLIDRLWCEEHNLQPLCLTCHSIKTKAENKLRRQYKKGKARDKSKNS